MASSWSEFSSSCKSRWSALARSFYLGRLHWFEKYREAKQAQEESREALAKCEARCRQLEQENQDLREQVCGLETELAEPRQIQLPLGDVPPGQQYGANMVALCVNLGRKLGIRPSVRALRIFLTGWEWTRQSRRTKPYAGGCKDSA